MQYLLLSVYDELLWGVGHSFCPKQVTGSIKANDNITEAGPWTGSTLLYCSFCVYCVFVCLYVSGKCVLLLIS